MFVRDVNIQPKRNRFRLASLESIFYVHRARPWIGPCDRGRKPR